MDQWFSAAPITAYLKRHGMTQSDFAKLIGVSDAAVSQWLAGTKGMKVKTAARIEKRTKREVQIRSLFPQMFSRSA